MAKVYLDAANVFTISNNDVSVYGSTGTEVITVTGTASGVTVNQTVEQLILPGARSSYSYLQKGNLLQIYSGSVLMCSITVQDDGNGTQLTFSDGTFDLKVSTSGMTIGGSVLSTTTPATISGTGTTTNFHTSVTGVDSASLLTTQSSIIKALNSGEKWSSTSLTYHCRENSDFALSFCHL